MASKTFTKEERSKHIESIRKQVKYLEDAERRLRIKLPTEEEKELIEEATNMQKPVGHLKSFFNFFTGNREKETKRLKRTAYEIRAQRLRTELFKSKDVELVQSNHNRDEIRVVVNGKCGKGKSALGNNLLRYDHFKSKASFKSITQGCSFSIRFLADGYQMLVIDTPGLFDTDKPDEEVQKEILKCVALAVPGPNIFIFVVSIERFTPEEMDTLTNLQKLFGEKVIDHVIIVFTRKDNLPEDDKIEFMKDVDGILLDLLVKCNFRFAFINNKADPDEIRVDIDIIMDLIFRTIAENNGAYYTNEEFKATDKVVESMIKEKEEKKEREIQTLKEEKDKLLQTLILDREPSSRESMIGQTDQKWGKEIQKLPKEKLKPLEEHQECGPSSTESRVNQNDQKWEIQKLSEEKCKPLEEHEECGPSKDEDKVKRNDKRTGSGKDSISITNDPTINTNNDGVKMQLEKIDKKIEEVKTINPYIEVKQDIERKDDTVNTLGQKAKKVLTVSAGIAAGVAAGGALVSGAPLVAAGAGVVAAASWLSSWWLTIQFCQ